MIKRVALLCFLLQSKKLENGFQSRERSELTKPITSGFLWAKDACHVFPIVSGISCYFYRDLIRFANSRELKRIQYLHLDLFVLSILYVQVFSFVSLSISMDSIIRQVFSCFLARCQIACSASPLEVRGSRVAMLSLINHSQPLALVGSLEASPINCEIFTMFLQINFKLSFSCLHQTPIFCAWKYCIKSLYSTYLFVQKSYVEISRFSK